MKEWVWRETRKNEEKAKNKVTRKQKIEQTEVQMYEQMDY